MAGKKQNIDELCINTIRLLSVDMVERAKSGHPGMPLGAAPMAYILFTKFLKHNPENSKWFNRDRFILSAGHGCALLYSLLHLHGYKISMDDLKKFRQYGSVTPGHPEYGLTDGVEATTGPLGQGFAMGVGMAIAERTLAECFNRKGFKVIDHYVYAIVSDGDLMEGVASEAASLAGTLELGKLIYLYDDNDMSIDGKTSLAFKENVRERFDAYGWHVQRVEDGNDTDAIEKAVKKAQEEKSKPSLIIVRTRLGYGSPKQDTPEAHGEPLGEDNMKKTKEFFGFAANSSFYVPDDVYSRFGSLKKGMIEQEKKWNAKFEEYQKAYPKEGKLLYKYITGHINRELKNNLKMFEPVEGGMATRAASGRVMNLIEEYMTEFMGGSADLATSTKTELKGCGSFGIAGLCTRNIHFGVREHAMGGIINGMALHGGLIPYSATFLTFLDYMREPVRLAAIMQTHSIFVFTHDSIALGEDGPTHQPVEHISQLRMVPGLTVIRPADANETVAAWYYAIVNKKPVVLIFTRQNVPVLDTKKHNVFDGALKGAYILSDEGDAPDILLVATGSEVHLALAAAESLKQKNIKARVISMPSYEIFMEQDENYRNQVIPPYLKRRLVIEAGATAFWRGLAGDRGDVLGVDKFGASAPGKVVMEKYGFTVENVLSKVNNILKKEI
jgi:transketolase